MVLRKLLVAGAAAAFLVGLAAALLLFTLSGPQLERRVVAALGNLLDPECTFSVGTVSYSFAHGFVLEGFRLKGPPGFHAEEFLAVKRLTAVPRIASLLGGDMQFREVIIEGLDITFDYSAEKRWNFMGLLRPRATGPDGGDDVRRGEGAGAAVLEGILLRGCSVRFPRDSLAALLDVSPAELPESMLRGVIDGRIVFEDRRAVIDGTITNPLLGAIAVKGTSAGGGGKTVIECSAFKIPLEGDARLLVPAHVRDALAAYEPSGTVDARFKVTLEAGRAPVVALAGRLFNGRLKLPQLPFDVRHLKGEFDFDGRRLSFPRGLEGALAEGRLDVRGAIDIVPQAQASRWNLAVAVDRLTLDERLAGSLSPDLKVWWERIKPRGQVGVKVEVSGADGAAAFKGAVTLIDVEAMWSDVPYAGRGFTGVIEFDRTRIVTESPLRGSRGATEIEVAIDGEIKRHGRTDVAVRLTNLVLDPYVRSCLLPEMRTVWDAFRLEGTADVLIRVAGKPGERVATTTTVDGRGMRICYEHFPYVIDRITGRLVIRKDGVEATDLAGYHGKTLITCRKGFMQDHAGGPSRFAFEFASPNLPLDQDLVRALPENYRRVLEDFEFSGNVDAKVMVLRMEDDAEARIEVDADILSGRARYARFPYPLALKGGRIHIGAEGIRVDDLDAEGADLVVCCRSATIEDLPARRNYDFTLEVKSLRPTPDLIAALPDHVARFMEGLAVEGTFEAPRIWVQYTHDKEDPDEFTLNYFAKDLIGHDVRMDLGMKFQHMRGKATIIGKASRDTPHKATGRLEIDRVRFHRMWFNDVLLKCSYGARHELLGAVDEGKQVEGAPPWTEEQLRPFLARIPDDAAARDVFQVWLDRGAAYAGTLRGFLAVDVGARKDLLGFVRADGVDLARASNDIFKDGQATGMGGVDAFFRGTIPDVKSFRGEGRVWLREANLVKLPLFVSMFRDIVTVRRIQESYFHKVEVAFDIRNGLFRARGSDAISMTSDIMTLRGFGTVDFDLNLDLYLSLPSFGLPNIPLVGDVLRRVVDNIMAFHVTGPLDDPSIGTVHMRDLQRLFK